MMLACRPSADRHRRLCQGYIRERRLDNWFRGRRGRSAPLESQESAGPEKNWLRRLQQVLCAYYIPLGRVPAAEDGGKELLQRRRGRPIN